MSVSCRYLLSYRWNFEHMDTACYVRYTWFEKYRTSKSQRSIDAELTHHVSSYGGKHLIEYILYSLQSTISRTRRVRPRWSRVQRPQGTCVVLNVDERKTIDTKWLPTRWEGHTRVLWSIDILRTSSLKGESDSIGSQNNSFENFDGDEQAHLMHGRESWHCCLGERRGDRYTPTPRANEECSYLSEWDSCGAKQEGERNGCIGSGVNGSDGV